VIDPAIDRAKQAAREKVWALLEREGAALPPGAFDRIPNFAGADQAATRLAELDVWKNARVIKANPDWAQLPVRVKALEEGKLLYMAVPKLATPKPFYLIDPATTSEPLEVIASGDGAAEHAVTIGVEDMQPVDLIVAGSVAVNREGVRVGKGAGYSDIEMALLTEAGLIRPDTVIVTTVHSLQMVDGELPETEHDYSLDLIVTPDEVTSCGPARRPAGIVVEHLTEQRVESIPVLRRYAR
jgi:5-formyltetrahydrofolate cyclo-ligase